MSRSRCRRLGRRRPGANDPKDGFFTATDGIKIHYLTLGDRGSWVVLIHGYSDSARRMWFTTGIAPEIAKTHRVVAIDNRNHGQSDKPQPGGSGRADDVIELMDYLKIDKAHIHGYSMGGGFVGPLLAKIPGRFITAGFGGFGHDGNRSRPSREGDGARRRAAESDGRRCRGDGSLPQPRLDGAHERSAGARRRCRARQQRHDRGQSEGTAPAGAQWRTRLPAAATVDLTSASIPMLAVNGAFDGPYSKTMRLWREVKVFHNVVLPARTHLTAIASVRRMPQQYVDEISRFIDATTSSEERRLAEHRASEPARLAGRCSLPHRGGGVRRLLRPPDARQNALEDPALPAVDERVCRFRTACRWCHGTPIPGSKPDGSAGVRAIAGGGWWRRAGRFDPADLKRARAPTPISWRCPWGCAASRRSFRCSRFSRPA